MRIRLPLTLQTRVGRRIALLFVVSALVPIAVLFVIGYVQVRGELVAQARAQLGQAAKNIGMGLVDQLNSADIVISDAALELRGGGAGPREGSAAGRALRATFASLAVVNRAGRRVLWGESPPNVTLSPADRRWIGDGRHLLRVDSVGPNVWIVIRHEDGAQVWAAVSRTHLMRGLPERARVGVTDTRVCVRAEGVSLPLVCQVAPASVEQVASPPWDLFLAYRFAAPPWHVEVKENLDVVLGPIEDFRLTFLLSTIALLGLVVFLSSFQVRRSLNPLAALGEGTRRVARRDFTSPVSVSSRDEFGDLATSFNQMAGEINQHFRTMTAASAIDQAALAGRRAEEVAATAAGRLRDAIGCASVDVYVSGERPEDAWRRVRGPTDTVEGVEVVDRPAARAEARLRAARGRWLGRSDVDLGWFSATGNGAPTVFPLVSQEELVGLVALHADGALSDERLSVARRLADQLTVGLSNARLIVRLNALSFGALTALARTVDANSHWTAGHSERVTSMSLRIADRLALPEKDMDTLHRGGLLHDIGKIGVPYDILDYPGPLDPQKLALVQSHPALGAQILTPITAFAEAIPIVRSHHEKMDGTGYPDGLKGNEIAFLARLLAVSDVYDALVSDRPYRVGWSTEAAVNLIKAETGTHFDPQMVEVFLRVLEREGDSARFTLAQQEATVTAS
ncbi:MAG TPA: HD domain-containing phosphohydrolase [Gemmatimonadaceae bacterium]|nr:HD domain-containing phosphohydrolase [Gemmatimonadaceae bacterium]